MILLGVCVVFVLAILSNNLALMLLDMFVCVVFVLAILSNSTSIRDTPSACVLYLF